jgi:hypothetical protein
MALNPAGAIAPVVQSVHVARPYMQLTLKQLSIVVEKVAEPPAQQAQAPHFL